METYWLLASYILFTEQPMKLIAAIYPYGYCHSLYHLLYDWLSLHFNFFYSVLRILHNAFYHLYSISQLHFETISYSTSFYLVFVIF